jgi:uncharacterized protein (TIGR00725 family)
LSQDENQALVVAIIGSARIETDDARWASAFELGQALALNGFTVMTGGYGGLMSATARGAFQEGGHTIGLPMSDWAHLTPDPTHIELRWSDDYFGRLSHLLSADYLIVLDGGIGTLSEMSLAWAIAQTESKHAKIIVIGEGIKKLLDQFMESLVISESDMVLAKHFNSISDVIAHIKEPNLGSEESGKARG